MTSVVYYSDNCYILLTSTPVYPTVAPVDTSDVDRLRHLYDDITTYYLWVLLAIGLPGNLLTILTFGNALFTHKLTLTSIGVNFYFVIYLAVSDAAALVVKALYM